MPPEIPKVPKISQIPKPEPEEAPEAPEKVETLDLDRVRTAYLKKNLDFFELSEKRKIAEKAFKAGAGTKEDYEKAKKRYETLRDDISSVELMDDGPIPPEFLELRTREDFERALNSRGPAVFAEHNYLPGEPGVNKKEEAPPIAGPITESMPAPLAGSPEPITPEPVPFSPEPEVVAPESELRPAAPEFEPAAPGHRAEISPESDSESEWPWTTARELFESLRDNGDTPEGQREAAAILKALDAGDTTPARNKLNAMIETHKKFAKYGISHNLDKLRDFLEELDLIDSSNSVRKPKSESRKEKSDDELTLDELKEHLKFAKDTARPLETAYWKEKIKNYRGSKARAEEAPRAETERETDAYSGRLRVGDSVNYKNKKWELVLYDKNNGDAILRDRDGNFDSVSQEKLYGQNPAEAAAAQRPAAEAPAPIERTDEATLDEAESASTFAEQTGAAAPEVVEERELDEAERAEAEKRKEELERLKKQLEEKYKELEEVRQARAEVTEEKEAIEKEIEGLEKQLAELEKNEKGGDFKKTIKSIYEKAKKKGVTVWGFMKERLKGFATFGLWEIKQAEVMRRGTKSTEETIKEMAEQIKEEEHLSMEEALSEAAEIRSVTEGLLDEDVTAGDYEFVSQVITKEKREQNNKIEDEIIEHVAEELEDKLELDPIIQGYRSAHGGEKVLTDENMVALKAELKAELKKLRNGQIRKDLVGYKELMRKNLDPKWWARYVYGPMEAVLMALGVKFVITKLAAEKTVGAGKAIAGQATEHTAQEAMEVGLKDTVWGEAKRQLVSHGVLNPSNAQIQQVATKIATDSAVNVPPWSLPGQVLHTQMQAGYPLKIANALKEIASIKAGL